MVIEDLAILHGMPNWDALFDQSDSASQRLLRLGHSACESCGNAYFEHFGANNTCLPGQRLLRTICDHVRPAEVLEAGSLQAA